MGQFTDWILTADFFESFFVVVAKGNNNNNNNTENDNKNTDPVICWRRLFELRLEDYILLVRAFVVLRNRLCEFFSLCLREECVCEIRFLEC